MFEQVFVIAEVGMSHDGSLGQAKSFIDAALEAGADAVKFQTHIFSEESLDNAPPPPYFSSESRKDFFERSILKYLNGRGYLLDDSNTATLRLESMTLLVESNHFRDAHCNKIAFCYMRVNSILEMSLNKFFCN